LIKLNYNDIKPRLEEKDVFNCFVYTDNIEENRKVLENVTENVTENRRRYILRIINQNNKITTEEIAKLVGVVRRTIARDIDFLKAKGVLLRVGSDKTGHWEIVKNLD
jgi:ATP-dependent DNA helicase RecG